MIRDATRKDRSALAVIAKAQTARYPKLRADVEKIHDVLTEVIDNPRHFARVVDVDGAVRGALVGISTDHLWAQRQSCQIVLWYSEVPGTGAALLRSFKTWIKEKRAVKIAGMAPDIDLDPRALALAERIGFAKHGGSYIIYN